MHLVSGKLLLIYRMCICVTAVSLQSSSATILYFTLTGVNRLVDFTWSHFTNFIPNYVFYQDNIELYEVFRLKKRNYDNNKIRIYELLEVF